jgi:UDP-glucuronate 4-epimerase
MLSGEKILITGAAGLGPFPIAAGLAKNNEVWGLARFSDPAARRKVEAAGIRPFAADLGSGDFEGLPADFTYLLHFAWLRAELPQLEEALRVNVEGAGLILQHCRKAKAALVVSGMGVYSTHTDPMHVYTEADPIGRGVTPYAATSPASKVGVEAVARFCARAFNLPITIARLNTVFGVSDNMSGNYHAKLVASAMDGSPFRVPGDPNPHSTIHTDDMQAQIEPLLGAAGVPALITNWCGDEVITTQHAAAELERIAGKRVTLEVVDIPGAPKGNAADPTRRRSITGPCQVRFTDGLERLYRELSARPDLIGQIPPNARGAALRPASA